MRVQHELITVPFVETKEVDKVIMEKDGLFLVRYKHMSHLHDEWIKLNDPKLQKRILKTPNPEVDRVIDEGEYNGEIYVLCKWTNQSYDQSTWELKSVIEQIAPEKQEKKVQIRDYQQTGVNWLISNYNMGQNCILADEMGLGKTVQSCMFLNQIASNGPCLVVCPLSTLQHWEREFKKWTNLNCVCYHGNNASRNLIVSTEFYTSTDEIKFNVLITTYEMAILGQNHLKLKWNVGIFDEAHKLKNKNSKSFFALHQLNFKHKVLLTGTPLQNKIEELWSLLSFLGINVEISVESTNDVNEIQTILQPLMLRRLKEDVEKSIPMKEETIIEVELTLTQKKWYRAILERNFSLLIKNHRLSNIAMELRKCCIHPYLLHGAEDFIVSESKAITFKEQHECMIKASGKLFLLDKLLEKLNGHKVLIFSQMTKCLDILADYLKGQSYSFERIDGNIRGFERQLAIDRFCNSDCFVFLLCTRAGGVGINLTAADTAIIFDSDWNPQNDLQAMARCHRIGQLKPVMIYRLITRNTYEKEMFDRASLKLGLDKAILQKDCSNMEIENLLKKGAYHVFDDEESKKFMEEDLDSIFKNRTRVVKHEEKSVFSKAIFVTNEDDSDFWQKFAEKAEIKEEPVLQQRRCQINASLRDFDEEDVIKWSLTEKLIFERKLMVFGIFMEKIKEFFPRRSLNCLRNCARELIKYLLTLEPNEEVSLFLKEQLDPHLQKPTSKQTLEFKSFLTQKYAEQLKKKAKFMISRILLLRQVFKVQNSQVPFLKPPFESWTELQDKDLIRGVLKHGYLNLKQMKKDPELSFQETEFPSKSELGSRLRKLVSKMLNPLKRKQITKWSKRERKDFYRTLCQHGSLKFEELIQKANLNKCLEETETYYSHIICLCLFLKTDSLKPMEMEGDNEITIDKAKKLLFRLEFMDKLRCDVLPNPLLQNLLTQFKRTPGLPEFWEPIHDHELLMAIANLGYGRYDLIFENEFFSKFTTIWPKESILNKRIQSICNMVSPKDQNYKPKNYKEPEFQETKKPKLLKIRIKPFE